MPSSSLFTQSLNFPCSSGNAGEGKATLSTSALRTYQLKARPFDRCLGPCFGFSVNRRAVPTSGLRLSSDCLHTVARKRLAPGSPSPDTSYIRDPVKPEAYCVSVISRPGAVASFMQVGKDHPYILR